MKEPELWKKLFAWEHWRNLAKLNKSFTNLLIYCYAPGWPGCSKDWVIRVWALNSALYFESTCNMRADRLPWQGLTCLKKQKWGAREMAQWAKHKLCMCGTLGSILSIIYPFEHHQKWAPEHRARNPQEPDMAEKKQKIGSGFWLSGRTPALQAWSSEVDP